MMPTTPLSDDCKAKLFALCVQPRTDAGTSLPPTWNHWGLYLDRQLTLKITAAMAEILAARRDEFDFICPIPTSGFPLGAILFSAAEMPGMISFHWKDARFHAEDALLEMCQGRKPRICAIDSSIQTGLSLYLCDQMVRERLGGEVVFATAIVNNDLVDAKTVDELKTAFLDTGRLETLCTMSDLRQFSGRERKTVR